MKKYTATVLIADGTPDRHGDVFEIDDVSFHNSIVPVTLLFDPKQPLGRAHLRKDDDRVVADLELVIDPPENMRIPAMGGRMDTVITMLTKKSVVITDVGLADNNVDTRIGPIESVDDRFWCDCGGRCPDCNPIPTRKRDPVPEGCEDCPGCPDCLEEVKGG